MRKALTLTDLGKLIDKLPRQYDYKSRGPYLRMAVYPDLYISELTVKGPTQFTADIVYTVEFRAEPTTVCGVECVAWFYGDVLVKVSV